MPFYCNPIEATKATVLDLDRAALGTPGPHIVCSYLITDVCSLLSTSLQSELVQTVLRVSRFRGRRDATFPASEQRWS